MAGNAVAQRIYEHLDGPAWRQVAELAHPGVGQRIDAVLAGAGTTAELPIGVAVKVLESLAEGDRGKVTVGDTRTTIAAYPGVTPAPTEPRTDPVPRLQRLFDGTAEEVAARLAKRAQLPSEAVELFAELDNDVAVACGHHVMRCLKRREAVQVLNSVARREGGFLVFPVVRTGRSTKNLKVRQVFNDALRDVLAAAGVDQIAGSPAKPTVTLPSWAPTRAQRIDLAAAALSCRYPVRVSADEFRDVHRALCDAAERDGKPLRSVNQIYDTFGNSLFLSAAAAGSTWEELRQLTDVTFAPVGNRAGTDARRVGGLQLLIDLGAANAPGHVFMDAAHELFADGPYDGHYSERVRHALVASPTELDTVTGLRITLRSGTTGNTIDGEVFAFLGGRYGHSPDVDVVRRVLNGEHGPQLSQALVHQTQAHLVSYSLLRLNAEQSCSPALEPLWDRIIEATPKVAEAYTYAAGNTALACALAALTRRISAAVDRAGAPPQVWSAVCDLLEGFDGDVDELVDVAAATVI